MISYPCAYVIPLSVFHWILLSVVLKLSFCWDSMIILSFRFWTDICGDFFLWWTVTFTTESRDKDQALCETVLWFALRQKAGWWFSFYGANVSSFTWQEMTSSVLWTLTLMSDLFVALSSKGLCRCCMFGILLEHVTTVLWIYSAWLSSVSWCNHKLTVWCLGLGPCEQSHNLIGDSLCFFVVGIFF